MSISRITDLFAANVDSFSNKNTSKRVSEETTESSSNDANSEAVTVDNKIATQSSETQLSRAQRVDSLRAAVASKNYNPPQPKVAEALFRDLF